MIDLRQISFLKFTPRSKGKTVKGMLNAVIDKNLK